MVQVNIREAKTQFSRLLKLAEAGEEVVIARNGVPVARLVAIAKEAQAAARSMEGPREVGLTASLTRCLRKSWHGGRGSVERNGRLYELLDD